MRLYSRLLAMLILASSAARAGDFGLTVDDSLSKCAEAVSLSRNSCPTSEVVADLRARFSKGETPRIAAVSVAFEKCSVWFESAPARTAVFGALAAIASEPAVHDEETLLANIACFPFGQMRRALDTALARKDLAPAARSRLENARSQCDPSSH